MVFDHARNWSELNLKLSSRTTAVEIHSLATNQSAHVKFSSDGTTVLERDLTAADLQNPGAMVRALAGDFPGAFDAVALLPAALIFRRPCFGDSDAAIDSVGPPVSNARRSAIWLSMLVFWASKPSMAAVMISFVSVGVGI